MNIFAIVVVIVLFVMGPITHTIKDTKKEKVNTCPVAIMEIHKVTSTNFTHKEKEIKKYFHNELETNNKWLIIKK